ncbi:MAG TPA: hypothetical protein VFP15_06480 [Gemmatimonadaceae bacterium]|nr:hypothetical protein [Gemmatimonadaceae bacterium]
MKPRYWKRKSAQDVLDAARKKVSRGTRYFNDAKELLELVAQKLGVERAVLQARIESLENPTLFAEKHTLPQVESPKAMFDRVLRELNESE